MDIFQSPRQSGKTARLLGMLAEDETLYFVAATHQAARYAYEQARSLGFEIPQERFLPAWDLSRTHTMFPGGVRLVVDELPSVLEAILGRPVVAATFSEKEESEVLFEWTSDE